MTGPDTSQIAVWIALWGPGMLILVGIFTLLRRPPQFIVDLVAAQQEQAKALGALAMSVMRLPQQSDLKFDEILIGQQMILQQLDKIDSQCRQRALICGTIQTVSESRMRPTAQEETRDVR